MQEYYGTLVKPFFAPPAWLFWPVWTILYIIIAISFWYIIYRVVKWKTDKKILFPLVLNLVTNILYTPIMFIMKSNLLATIDILLVLWSIIWLMLLTCKKKKDRIFMYAMIPYLLWVSFATILQVYILIFN